SIETALDDRFVGIVETVIFKGALLQSRKQRVAIWAGEVENFLHVDHLFHDLRLTYVPRDAIEHEDIDVRFEFVRVHRRIDRFFPEFHGNLIRHELAFTGVFQKCFAHFGARVDGAKHVAAWAMIKTRDAAERFALRALAAAGRAEENERVVSNERNQFIHKMGTRLQQLKSAPPRRGISFKTYFDAITRSTFTRRP